jgi:hypothetical protein
MKSKLLLLMTLGAVTVSQAQMVDSYATGYYFDANNNKHTGLLKLNAVYSSLEFKTDEVQKPVKLSTQEVIAFVMEKDSFTVVEDYEVPYGFSSTTISSSFAKVIKTGEVNLYEVATVVGYQQNAAIISGSYLLQKNNSSQVVRVPDGARGFKNILSDYFSESGIVSQHIKSGTFTHDHLLEIVDLYNREHTISAIAVQTRNGF